MLVWGSGVDIHINTYSKYIYKRCAIQHQNPPSSTAECNREEKENPHKHTYIRADYMGKSLWNFKSQFCMWKSYVLKSLNFHVLPITFMHIMKKYNIIIEYNIYITYNTYIYPTSNTAYMEQEHYLGGGNRIRILNM